MDCKRIYAALQNLVSSGAAEKLSDSSLGDLRKKHKENGLDSDTNLDVSWRLLNAKVSSRETRVLLSQAVAIFHVSILGSCFDVHSLGQFPPVIINMMCPWFTCCTIRISVQGFDVSFSF